ncbi:MAG: NAD(P)H-dependent glycerol-3-phosphate dehydrogenase [Candidatus Phytoplasma stylosanthis]|uniref:NAD(P)H-dependent glycerol-3-phosphate dehydrogenase n=1 Tax=Candidatus Phytoplasma stylosanthis TaxID=2798314 RepID=UPI00293A3C58|nr:NAD(P)H-dependent glycerol-3-phosphate dehydrogenase [Candidatus Phytoplasma stylosanthis]MDV3168045.1 NAD(P)H-dependent glycerol-3-phosphate dehydrogenase [Candidatus Phytoplasma stylosanthis]MDV3170809.1 NAD(P)H-dependent glycerol-3-phosphate dehydrogenase [Candidatus Phytoplasma stylosanthis]MDV3173595.1 NAD(P)H-dependent glycerol-3-phosphate dehydrogenase [Candidatus Phytoplasma stylosanthis]MDV3174177.1 NAD(P)H-dependent glycerol-3-phosphate dehydrogenase [Candidatus Phytoplasma stylosa
MKKVTIIGGGSWGLALSQVLTDNKNEVLIYDNDTEKIKKINDRKHPFLDILLPINIKATDNLKQALSFSNFIFLSIPTQNMRSLLKQINLIIDFPKNFINTSKGIEYKSNKIISQILKEEIDMNKIQNYAYISGPSHAEEVIIRKITFIEVISLQKSFALQISKLLSNPNYFKVIVSNDITGAEICSSFKNALSLVSGILDSQNFSDNAKSAFITLGLKEMKLILNLFSSTSEKTVLSLSGVGDLIVTSFNKKSRNYQFGQKINLGESITNILKNSKQTIEGIHNLKVFYNLAIQNKIKLPIIENAYQVIFQKKSIKFLLKHIFEQIE